MTLSELAKQFNSSLPDGYSDSFQRNGAFFAPLRDGNYNNAVEHLCSKHAQKMASGVLLGIGGSINLSIAARGNMKGVMLVAPDKDQFLLWQEVLPVIARADGRQECIERLARLLESLPDNENFYSWQTRTQSTKAILNTKPYEMKPLLGDKYNFPSPVVSEDDLRFPFDYEKGFRDAYTPIDFSFLDSDSAFDSVQKMVQEGRVGVVDLNMMDKERCQLLADMLHEQGHSVAVIRLSNMMLHYHFQNQKTGYLGDAVENCFDTLEAGLGKAFDSDAPLVIEHATKNELKRPYPKVHESVHDCISDNQ